MQLSSDWDEFRTEAGIPCGSVTGLTATMQKRIIRWLYCVPACAARIKDAAAKYYVALRLSLPRGIGMIIAANPSTLVNLARTGDQEKEVADPRPARRHAQRPLRHAAEIRAALSSRLRRPPSRAGPRAGGDRPADRHALPARLLAHGLHPRQLDGRQRRRLPAALSALLRRHPGARRRPDRQRRPHDHPAGRRHAQRRARHHHATTSSSSPRRKRNSAKPTVLAAHEVEEGRNYFILPTTAFGLYRYHIHDVVRVTGFHNGTPLVEFLSKGVAFRQHHRRKAVGIPRDPGDGQSCCASWT